MESKCERKVKFEQWLVDALDGDVLAYSAMPGDASFRTYFRVQTPSRSYVAMNAPPPENCQTFAAIAAALRGMGLQAPEVFSADIHNGFLLLTDFGDTTFLKAFNNSPTAELVDDLYDRALRALSVMQACRYVHGVELKPFGREWMQREWEWHQEWFLEKWLGISAAGNTALHSCYELLMKDALLQPQVFMHRDYHSANLMVLPDNGAGILDFQDAFIGPLTYDLASLLRDCYVDWPEAETRRRVLMYAELLRKQDLLNHVTDADFIRWFDWMGLQRHIKALMTFARKFVRDQQPRYLAHVPRTLNYIIQVSRYYPELRALSDYYAGTVQQAVKDAKTVCVP